MLPPAPRLQAYVNDLRPSVVPGPLVPAAPVFGGPYGTRPTFGRHRFPLNYSDGDQSTLDVLRPGSPEYRPDLDFDGDDFKGDGSLTDLEFRDSRG